MDVITSGPLRVASIVWQPRPGAFALVFVCKATYLLAPGTSLLADAPDEPHLRDQPWDDDDRRSLARAADLVPFKRHADVILTGHAHAPGGRPVGVLLVRMVAGDVDKTIAVHGDRSLGPDDRVSDPLPFTRAPLRWERAAGGPGTANPAGMRLDAPPDARGAVPVPNLMPPDRHVAGRRDVIPPAGFMPVSPRWPGRADKLGPHAVGWDPRRWSEAPLPDDVDAGYFNAAPADQQVREIRADERLVLENLHPDHPRLVTNLEAIALSAEAEPAGSARHEVRLRCDTLSIDTDRGTASLVWRGHVRLAHPAQAGRVVVTLERRGVPGLAAIHAKLGGTGAVDLAALQRGEALPFAQGASPLAQAPAEPIALPGLVAAHRKFGRTTAIDPAVVRQRVALPFDPPTPPSTRAPEPPQEPADALPGLTRAHQKFGGTTGIDPAILKRAGEELPFVPGTSPLAAAQEPPDALPALARAHQKLGGTAGIDPAILRREALPFGSSAPSAPVAPESSRTIEPEPVPVAPVSTAAPPPMIGPLATPEMSAGPEPSAPLPVVEAAPAAPEPAGAVEAALPPERYPLERCAAITASVARRKAEKGAILERHELDAEVWARLEQHWGEAIQKDLGRGKTAMLGAFDAAYVAQLEEERGIVTVEEYARLVVAAERGAEKEVLEALDLPKGSMMRVGRVWEKRVAGSGALGKRVRKAVREAGEA